MTHNEFKEFLKTLNKKDLIKIIFDQNKDNSELQESIFLTYTPELTFTPADFRKFLNKINAIEREIFDPEYIHLNGLEPDKFCELHLDLIKTQIEPLVKRGLDFEAYRLLLEVYDKCHNDLVILGYSTYDVPSFFNKVRRGLQQIAEKASPVNKLKIEKLINTKIEYSNTYWEEENFHNLLYDLGREWWEDERDTVLKQTVDQFMAEMDFSKLAPDDFSELALLLLQDIEDTGTEVEVNAFLEKYNFLGDIIRYKARLYREQENFLEAKKILREAKHLPTLSQEQLRLNSNFLIETMLLERMKNSEDQQIPALLAELKENLENYEQETVENLVLYLLYIDEDQIDEAYSNYKDKDNTEYLYNVYTGDYIETLVLAIKALKNKDYKVQAENFEMAFPLISKFEPGMVADFLMKQIKLLLEEKASNKVYSQIADKILALWTNSGLDEYYQELKRELKKKYPRDKKLKMIFDEIEKSVRI